MSRTKGFSEEWLRRHNDKIGYSRQIGLKNDYKGVKSGDGIQGGAKDRKLGRPAVGGQAILELHRSKYGNKKVVDGVEKFDSKKEWRRWLVLCDMQNKGEIRDLRRQVTFLITHGKVAICKYIADFQYIKVNPLGGDDEVVEDVKGMNRGAAYSVFRLKKKLMKAFYSIEILET